MILRRLLVALLAMFCAAQIPEVRAQIFFAWESWPRHFSLPPVWRHVGSQEVMRRCGPYMIGCAVRSWGDGLCYIYSGRAEDEDPEHTKHEKHHCKGYDHRVTDLSRLFWKIR